jgi:hypothetical protein
MEEQYPDHLIGALHILITYLGLNKTNFIDPLESIRMKTIQETLALVYGVDVQSTEGIYRIMNSPQYKALDKLFHSKLVDK